MKMHKPRELKIKPLPKKITYWDGAYNFKKNIIYLGNKISLDNDKAEFLEILNHEFMHKILYELEGEETGWSWDNYEHYEEVDQL